ncbi:MAG: succinylglutamate desuccinylase/aspartoacylase family protein [Magnetococcales bacterium]|nr:succinylglutamate desuccinylase/aspartoacylase family protein [Magnetococcales bacterium]
MGRTAKNNPFVINGDTIQPGERKTVNLPITKLYTHTPVSLTVHVIHGNNPGPCLFVSAAIHGDELNGVEIIRRLLNHPGLRNLHGTLLAVPVVNVLGFLHRSRYFPDRRDLNRCFPGVSRGSLASQTAALFMESIVAPSTCGIDLHTGAIHRSNLPQTRGLSDDPLINEISQAFNTPIHLHTQLREGSLRLAAHEAGVPVLLYEAGEALRLDEASIRAGLKGVLRVMRYLKMLPGGSKLKKVCGEWCAAHSSRWIRAPVSGIAQSVKPIGARVQEGEVIAYVYNPLGTEKVDMVAPKEGIIIGCSNLPMVNQGDAMFHIAFVQDAEALEDKVQETLELFHEDPDDEYGA